MGRMLTGAHDMSRAQQQLLRCPDHRKNFGRTHKRRIGSNFKANHELLRDYLEIESIIPPRAGRPTQTLPTTKWRWLMATAFDEASYGQRWQVETVMSKIKRRQGEALTARSVARRHHELGLMAITHNLMIVLPERVSTEQGRLL